MGVSTVVGTLALLLVLGLRLDDPPPLSELESAKIRVVNLEVQRVNTLYELANAAKEKADHAAADAQEHMAALKHDLELKRPGWTVDITTGKWTKAEKPK